MAFSFGLPSSVAAGPLSSSRPAIDALEDVNKKLNIVSAPPVVGPPLGGQQNFYAPPRNEWEGGTPPVADTTLATGPEGYDVVSPVDPAQVAEEQASARERYREVPTIPDFGAPEQGTNGNLFNLPFEEGSQGYNRIQSDLDQTTLFPTTYPRSSGKKLYKDSEIKYKRKEVSSGVIGMGEALANDLFHAVVPDEQFPAGATRKGSTWTPQTGSQFLSEAGFNTEDDTAPNAATPGRVAAAMTVGALSVIDSVAKQRLLSQKGLEYTAETDEEGTLRIPGISSDESEGVPTVKEENIIKGGFAGGDLSPTVFESRILNAQLSDMSRAITRAVQGRPTESGFTPDTSSLSTQSTVAAAQAMINAGYLYLARDDNTGEIFLAPTRKGLSIQRDAFHWNEAYDAQARLATEGTSERMSQAFPVLAHTPATVQAQVTASMGIKNISQLGNTATNLLDQVPFNGNTKRAQMVTSLLQDAMTQGIYFKRIEDGNVMVTNSGGEVEAALVDVINTMTAEERQAFLSTAVSVDVNSFKGRKGFMFSLSPYASSVATLDASDFQSAIQEIKRGNPDSTLEDQVKKAIGSQSRKVFEAIKDIQQYIPRTLETNRWGFFKLSSQTSRGFEQGTDVNYMNKGGTLRAIMQANKTKHNVINMAGKNNTLTKAVKSSLEFLDINLNSDGVGKAFGAHIQQKLLAANSEDLSLAGAMMMVFLEAIDLGIVEHPNPNKTPLTVLDAVRRSQLGPEGVVREVAKWGDMFNSFNPDNLPGTFNNKALPDQWTTSGQKPGKMFERKEWGFHTSIQQLAAQLRDSEGRVFNAQALTTVDGRQSNAWIMSLLIGDANTAKILGYAEVYKEGEVPIKDLRAKMSTEEAIQDAIDNTFNGEDDDSEEKIRSGFKAMLEEVREHLGGDFNKWFARGMVVAGLYGKSPRFMFSEIEDMRAKDIQVRQIMERYQDQLYQGNQKEFDDDMGALFSTVFATHLPELKGFQEVMKSLGELLAATNSGTQIETFAGIKADIGEFYYNLTGHSLEIDLGNATLQGNGGVQTITMPEVIGRKDIHAPGGREQHGLVAQEDIINGKEQTAKVMGTKSRSALPVNVVQSGDAAMFLTTVVLVNDGLKSGEPKRYIKGIHDALILDPGSFLLGLNAMNNITPYTIAESAPGLFQGILDKVDKSINRIVKSKQKEFDISLLGDYPSVLGYFDRVWQNTYLRTGEKASNSTRKMNENLTKLREENQMLLKQAEKLGYIPPSSDANIVRRKRPMNISKQELLDLISLIQAGSGWLNPNEKKPYGFTGSIYSASRNFERLKNKSTGFIARNKAFQDTMRGSTQWKSNSI